MTLTTLLSQLSPALRKLDPRHLWRSPVMFIVWIGSVMTTVIAIADPSAFAWVVTAWLWLTVIFGNLAEAVAEGRGKAQAASLRAARTDVTARRLDAAGLEETIAGTAAPQGRSRRRRGRRDHPRRRRRRRRCRIGRRVGDHRRVRAGHPRGRR